MKNVQLDSSRNLAFISILLFFTGAGSLILEVVWSRLLRLVFGSTTLAVSTILVAYMLGLGLGGLWGGRVSGRLKNGLKAYGWIEIGIGLYAFLVPAILSLYPQANRAFLGSLSFWPAAWARFFLVLAALLLPTLLMGATLPVLVAALVRGSDPIASRVGLLYGLNTLGAVAGVAGTAFFLFPALGVQLANFCGAAFDLGAGLFVLIFLAPRLPLESGPESGSGSPKRENRELEREAARARRWSLPLFSYGLVGLTALVYEVAWTRALAMVFGSSVYAFASMLAAFLLGIALGSLAARRWLDGLRLPVRAYSAGLALLGCLSLATVLSFQALPDLFLWFFLWFGLVGRAIVVAGIVISILAMLGPTLVLGALFPLLVRTLASRSPSTGQTVGDVYFLNTMGSAAGALLAGFILIPFLGLRWTMTAAVALNFLSAAVVLSWQMEWRGPGRAAAVAGLLAASIALCLRPLAWNADGMTRGSYYQPKNNLEMGLPLLPMEGVVLDEIVYYRDGVNATVSVHRGRGGINLRINGKTDASMGDMETQLLLGHIPMLFGGAARTVLVIGHASGVTTGSVTLHRPEAVEVVEIEPAIVEASHFFDAVNQRPFEKKEVRLILDDGRTYLSYSDKKYGAIISEPSNPFISGCSNLFTRDFFRLVKQALLPGGRFLQWVQLYGMDGDGLRSLLAALQAEFGYIYGFLFSAQKVDLLLLAMDEPLRREQLPRWESLAPEVQAELAGIEIFCTADLWSLLRLLPEEIQEFARKAPEINTDDSMYVELLAPWMLHQPAEENQKLFDGFRRGVLPIADGPERALDSQTLGQLAIAYLEARHQPGIAEELAREAKSRGSSAAGLIAGYLLSRKKGLPEPDAAGALLDQAAELAPEGFEPRYFRARQRIEGRRYPEALEDIEVALKARPGDLRVLRLRMQLLSELERPIEARKDAEALLGSKLALNDPEVWADAAIVAAACKRFDDAIREMKRFLEVRPFSPREWEYLAEMYKSIGSAGKADGARSNAEKARKNQMIFSLRAVRREAELGSKTTALELLRAILEQEPNSAEAKAELSRLQVSGH